MEEKKIVSAQPPVPHLPPTVWGGFFWLIYHSFGAWLDRVKLPFDEAKLAMISLIMLLPCAQCSDHAREVLNQVSGETVLASRYESSWLEWTWRLRETIAKRTNRPLKPRHQLSLIAFAYKDISQQQNSHLWFEHAWVAFFIMAFAYPEQPAEELRNKTTHFFISVFPLFFPNVDPAAHHRVTQSNSLYYDKSNHLYHFADNRHCFQHYIYDLRLQQTNPCIGPPKFLPAILHTLEAEARRWESLQSPLPAPEKTLKSLKKSKNAIENTAHLEKTSTDPALSAEQIAIIVVTSVISFVLLVGLSFVMWRKAYSKPSLSLQMEVADTSQWAPPLIS